MLIHIHSIYDVIETTGNIHSSGKGHKISKFIVIFKSKKSVTRPLSKVIQQMKPRVTKKAMKLRVTSSSSIAYNLTHFAYPPPTKRVTKICQKGGGGVCVNSKIKFVNVSQIEIQAVFVIFRRK